MAYKRFQHMGTRHKRVFVVYIILYKYILINACRYTYNKEKKKPYLLFLSIFKRFYLVISKTTGWS